ELGLTFGCCVELVGLYVVERLQLATRPSDLHRVRANTILQSEARSQITLRQIASATCDFSDLRHASGNHSDTGANAITIAFCPDQVKVQEMIAIAAAIVKEQRCGAIIADDYVEESVVVKVGERDAAADVGSAKPGPCPLAGVKKLSVALVVKQRICLPVAD